MKYKRGSKIEVLRKSKVSRPCSWRPAEIMYGNGHNYVVRYDTYMGDDGKGIVETVSRKSIRPCPPPLELPGNLVPGDAVEVFHNFSWKIATVVMVLGRDYFLTRLFGSSQEFNVGKFEIRLRQSWQDGKWIVIEKHDSCSAKKNIDFQDFHVVSQKGLKRGSPAYCYSQDEVDAGAAKKKYRAIERENRGHRADEQSVNASKNNKTTRLSAADTDIEKINCAVRCSPRLEPNDVDSTVTSSVGSCSIACDNFSKSPHLLSRDTTEDAEDCLSDAESCYRWESNEADCLPPTEEELKSEIHKSELHAYHCALESIFTSGPLSWEQELLVTDL